MSEWRESLLTVFWLLCKWPLVILALFATAYLACALAVAAGVADFFRGCF